MQSNVNSARKGIDFFIKLDLFQRNQLLGVLGSGFHMLMDSFTFQSCWWVVREQGENPR